MKEYLKAASVCGEYVVLYDQGIHKYALRITNRDTRWMVYCTDVELEYFASEEEADLVSDTYELFRVDCYPLDPKKSVFDQIQEIP